MLRKATALEWVMLAIIHVVLVLLWVTPGPLNARLIMTLVIVLFDYVTTIMWRYRK